MSAIHVPFVLLDLEQRLKNLDQLQEQIGQPSITSDDIPAPDRQMMLDALMAQFRLDVQQGRLSAGPLIAIALQAVAALSAMKYPVYTADDGTPSTQPVQPAGQGEFSRLRVVS